jgi:L-lactate permease
MTNASVQVLLGHLTKDDLASRAGTVLAPAAHVMYEVEFRWLLVGFLALSAVLALLRGTRYKAVEDAGANRKVQPLRWVDYGLTGAVAFSIAALLNGMQDLVALKVSAIAILVAAYLGWVFERENAVSGKPARSVYTASAVLTVVPVAFLVVTMLATNIYGMVRSPWYAYVAAAIAVVYLLMTTRMPWSGCKSKLDFVYANRAQNRFATVCKLAFAVVLIIGLYSK